MRKLGGWSDVAPLSSVRRDDVQDGSCCDSIETEGGVWDNIQSSMTQSGGRFCSDKDKTKYIDGEVTTVDWCDRDRWSVIEAYDVVGS
ncbi:hypothetical protein Ahy_B05g078944 isoform B [Arachis hypogaea]|uniref:PB1-like domain-containing protein n=1 Tax=Arachis hypogaea TaxID=3818 RepID=A0A444Z8J5_ARAHY|nr:hypothetical protein Ahy_B05g078944 isoform B [Arachis hypogaea]